MNHSPHDHIDPRAWLLWGAAASLPPLLGRNPLILSATLMAVLGVRAARGSSGLVGWNGIVRIACIFALVGALFNALTVHVGDRPIAHLPDSWPILGGPITLNAIVYGLLSGTAMLILVIVGTTLGSVLDGPALLRLLPARLTTVAVAGSVAWGFVPQTAIAFRQIREAQAARGHRPRSVRDLVPFLVPLITIGLERAMTLAEALEARAFGAPMGGPDRSPVGRGLLVAASLSSGAVGAYLLAAGSPRPALGLLAGSLVALVLGSREPGSNSVHRTRYRQPRWNKASIVIGGSGGIVLLMEFAVLVFDPAAFAYEPYPRILAPRVDLPLMIGLGALLLPAFLSPPSLGGTTWAPDSRLAWDIDNHGRSGEWT